jgi:NAD(P)-dependent dehydrogenase (short-subunit alcohol dehydrogenase family)
MFTFDLAREFDPAMITANCLHPATYMAATMVRGSMAIPASSTTGWGRREQAHKPMKFERESGYGC